MPDLPPAFAPAKVMIFVLAASYVLSAAILAFARYKGETVPTYVIALWAVTGVAAFALAPLLAPGRALVWVGLLVALAPWMAWSLYGDGREGRWVMVAVDALGLAAIAFALGTTARAALGPAV